jgi:hypothetical protein
MVRFIHTYPYLMLSLTMLGAFLGALAFGLAWTVFAAYSFDARLEPTPSSAARRPLFAGSPVRTIASRRRSGRP